MLYYQTKTGGKWTSSFEDRAEIVTFWLYEPLLWCWQYTEDGESIFLHETLVHDAAPIFFAWHSGSWRCITIPSLVSKWSAVQKLLSGQTFANILNPCWDLDLDHNNPIFAQDTLVYNVVLSNQVWLQKKKQSQNSNLKDLVEIVIFWLHKPLLWPWHWRQWTNFTAWHTTLW